MSVEAMIEVIERVGTDAEFSLQVRTNPDAKSQLLAPIYDEITRICVLCSLASGRAA